jgi:hypothetical protein
MCLETVYKQITSVLKEPPLLQLPQPPRNQAVAAAPGMIVFGPFQELQLWISPNLYPMVPDDTLQVEGILWPFYSSVIQSLRYIPANVAMYNYTEIVFLGPTAIAFNFRQSTAFP